MSRGASGAECSGDWSFVLLLVLLLTSHASTPHHSLFWSCQDPLDDSGFVDAGELLLESVHLEAQLIVVKAQEVQNRGVPVGYAHPVLDGSQAELVGAAVG